MDKKLLADELRASIAELRDFLARLLARADRLPDAQPVLARSRVHCVVQDRISPAIEDLEAITAEVAPTTSAAGDAPPC